MGEDFGPFDTALGSRAGLVQKAHNLAASIETIAGSEGIRVPVRMLEVGRCYEGQCMKKLFRTLSILWTAFKALNALERLLDSIDDVL